jgi:hypothetical protein
LSLPPFVAFFFPFHTPGGAISLPRQDYSARAGIGGLLIDKNSAIRALVVTLDIHSVVRELHAHVPGDGVQSFKASKV